MTTPQPTPPEPADSMAAMTPMEYLKHADRELAAGNDRRAATLLWKATESIFISLARERGLEYDDLFEVALALEKEKITYRSYFTGNLMGGEALRDHGLEDEMERYSLEDYQLETHYRLNHKFILERCGDYE